jgi:dTDP-glucose 4,6-dehydratase
MRIFLTGGSGFIGSNLIPKLLEQGHDVYALTRYVSNRTPNYPKEVQVVFGDLRDSLMLKKSIREITPEVVVHLGAISPVQRSFGHSQEVFETNTMGTMNLADANLENPNLEKFIFAGTSEMYGDQLLSDSTRPLHEIDILKPNQPYAISKDAASNYLNYLSKAYDFPICVARPFNTYGRTENFNFVTERIIHGMLTKNSITLGNPDPVRDLLYVDDHVEGYLKIINSTVFPEAVNFCTGVGTSIRELAETIKEKLDWTGEIYWGRTMKRPTEIDCLIGDNSLAKETLGWEPKINLDKGLNLTISKINKKLENLE